MTASRTPSVAPLATVRGGWSDAAVETLKALWGDPDFSAAIIAQRLGVTRNAVLGKVHRLGLSKPRTPRSSAGPVPPRRRRLVRSAAVSSPPPHRPAAEWSESNPDVRPGLVSHLEDLPRRACHWPIGDPQAPDFAFCGRPAGTGPYCAGHAAVAYRGPGVNVAELARLLRR
jgi:GcrA cell cycle regulator